MRSPIFFVLALSVAFCPACGGCGHDKVIIKDDPKPAPVTVVQPAAPAAPAPAPSPAPTVNVNNNK